MIEKTMIPLFIKFGRQEHLEQLRQTGSLRMCRLDYYQRIEDAARRDEDDGLSALYQPSKVRVKIGEFEIPESDFAGPVKVFADQDSAQHVF